MKDYRPLESLISASLEAYKEGFNASNDEYEIEFFTTLTTHKVDVEGFQKDVAYLRVERGIKPKTAGDNEWDYLLIYNQAYKFKNIKEQLEPTAPWKYELYIDLVYRLIAGGIEYSELLKRMQQTLKAGGGKPIAENVLPEEVKKPDILITNQMPAPLTENDKAYLEWVKKNGERIK